MAIERPEIYARLKRNFLVDCKARNSVIASPFIAPSIFHKNNNFQHKGK